MSNKIKVVNNPNEGRDEIDLARLFGVLIDNKWLITSITTLFTLIGLLYVMLATPIYKADALIQVEQNAGNSLLSNLSQVLPTNSNQSTAEVELIQSRMVLGKTVEDLNLETVVRKIYFPIVGRGLARIVGEQPENITISRLNVPENWINKELKIAITGKDSFEVENDGAVILQGKVGVFAQNDIISLLVSSIQAKPGSEFTLTKRSKIDVINEIKKDITVADKGKDTGVLVISLESDDPTRARNIIDHISRNYLLQNVERKSEEAGKSLTFLKKQLPEVREALNISETELNKYRQSNDSVDLTLEAKSVLDSGVSLDSQLNELTFKEAEISKLYTKEHPAYRSLLEKRAILEEERNKLNKKIGALPKTQQEILRLTRDVQAGQEIYMQLLNKEQELSITKNSTVGNVRIIDNAVTQTEPVKPKKALIVILAMVGGVLIAVSIVIAKMLLHRGIESAEQLEENGINVYASIPLSEKQRKSDKQFKSKDNSNARANELLAIADPTDTAIEAIRSLRTSLHFAMLEAKNNVLMISGATPEIGKTFVSTNLSAVIAKAGQKVLFIDADMRKGYAHFLVNTEWKDGLSDYLSGAISISESIKLSKIENMSFISRGQIPPNPSELLMHHRLEELLDWASKNYDLVIIDTPPLLAVTDAAIIGQYAGTTLLVSGFEKNTVKEVEVSIRRFLQNGIDVKGTILNGVVRSAANKYSYGEYEYYSYKSKE